MYKIFIRCSIIVVLSFVTSQMFAQGIAVNSDSSSADANAILDVKSTTKGFLPPRMTAAQRATLSFSLGAVQKGMLVADATDGHLLSWNGSGWDSTILKGQDIVGVNAVTNTVSLNSGTSAGDLVTWNGTNWINSQPAVQHFSLTATNMQPYITVNYCIASSGVFPSRSDDEPYIGEIQIFSFGFAPTNWLQCNGQLIAISSHTAMFSLLGTYYGGNGITTFGIPDLRGRAPLHMGTGSGLSPYTLGQSGGSETATFTR